jgi:hypothetical protein
MSLRFDRIAPEAISSPISIGAKLGSANAIVASRFTNASMTAGIGVAACLEQEPGAPFGFVYPDFDKTSRGNVAVLIADAVGLAEASGKRLALVL